MVSTHTVAYYAARKMEELWLTQQHMNSHKHDVQQKKAEKNAYFRFYW